jgi:excisionase family DNA binding protein
MVTQTGGPGQAAPAMIRVSEAARRLGWDQRQVLRAIREGCLEGHRPGLRNWMVLTASVDAVLRYGGGADLDTKRALKDIALRAAELAAECLRLEAQTEDAR